MTEIIPLPAATVAIVREARAGLEVLMLQRNFQSGFMAGMHLFFEIETVDFFASDRLVGRKPGWLQPGCRPGPSS